MPDVSERRMQRVMDAVAAEHLGRPELRLCLAASKLLDSAGVGLSLGASNDLLDSGLHTLCVTDGGRSGESQQFDLGEGPSYTAHRTGGEVQVADLDLDDTWPAFTEAAVLLGFHAVFAFPLRSGSVTLGALTIYRHIAGALTPEEFAVALVVVGLALKLLTSIQAGHPVGELDQVFTDTLSDSVGALQASGVVSVQLGITVGAAFAVLRAHAFAETCSLADVATQVIAHRLMLGPLQN